MNTRDMQPSRPPVWRLAIDRIVSATAFLAVLASIFFLSAGRWNWLEAWIF